MTNEEKQSIRERLNAVDLELTKLEDELYKKGGKIQWMTYCERDFADIKVKVSNILIDIRRIKKNLRRDVPNS